MIIVGSAAIWALSWEEFKRSAQQFYTNKTEKIIYKETIELSPGNIKIGTKQQIEIKVLNPDTRLKHRLFYRYDKEWRELALTNFSYLFNSLENSIEYYVKNDVASSAVFKIEVLEEPFVKWKVEYQYPAYTGLRAVSDTLSYGNIEAYKYTTVKLSVESNIPVTKVMMNRGDGQQIALQRLVTRQYSQFQLLSSTWYGNADEWENFTPVEKSISCFR